MKTSHALFGLTLLIPLFLGTSAWAATATHPVYRAKNSPVTKINARLFQWTDQNGNLHFTDTLPPEALAEGHTELSQSGTVIRTVSKPLTAEELALKAQQAQAAADQQAQAQKVADAERILRTTYPTEDSIHQDFQQRRLVYDGKKVALRAEIAQSKRELMQLLTRAGEAQTSRKTIGPKMTKDIDLLTASIQGKQHETVEVDIALKALDQEEANVVAQWKVAQSHAR